MSLYVVMVCVFCGYGRVVDDSKFAKVVVE